jgi:hypothetical protein
VDKFSTLSTRQEANFEQEKVGKKLLLTLKTRQFAQKVDKSGKIVDNR